MTEHLRITGFCIYLWVLRRFSKHLFYKESLENCFFHVQVAEFQSADAIKNFFASAFQAFYTRTRSSHSKVFIYVKPMKIILEEVIIRNKVARCQHEGLWKKLFRTISFLHLSFIFSGHITITSFKEALNVCKHNFFHEI